MSRWVSRTTSARETPRRVDDGIVTRGGGEAQAFRRSVEHPGARFVVVCVLFVLVVFVASLLLQMVSIVQTWGNQSLWVEILITMVIFGGCFTIDIYLEKDLLKQNYLEQMTVKEVAAAAIMAVAIFAFSNLSFLNENAPFASRERADIFSIRTLIDFGGIAILHAYQM